MNATDTTGKTMSAATYEIRWSRPHAVDTAALGVALQHDDVSAADVDARAIRDDLVARGVVRFEDRAVRIVHVASHEVVERV